MLLITPHGTHKHKKDIPKVCLSRPHKDQLDNLSILNTIRTYLHGTSIMSIMYL